ncbi:hypothetical protein [Halorussus litoreus]|uniref:hypothetical protein n=1 Tax=Halorussus litoreus TaxID=1710536 RepID=UPI000E27DA4E|nr:hypothetical protein [Halorussus litoreus]
MVETGYLASALVTGALLLAVWALASRLENWRTYEPAPAAGGRGESGGLGSPATWSAGFVLMVAVVGGGAVLLVSDASLAAGIGGWTTVAGAFGALLLGFALWGTYSSARSRGVHSAQAALLSAWLFGSLFVLVVAVKLLVSGG